MQLELACRLPVTRLSAIHRPEQEHDELSAIPAAKLAYKHNTSSPAASNGLSNGSNVNAYGIRASLAHMQPGAYLASQVDERAQPLQGLGGMPAPGPSTAQLEVLAEDSLGATSPIWTAESQARNQKASSILPADELDALLKQPLDVVYSRYMDFLSQGAFEPALRLLNFCVQSKRQDVLGR